MQRKHRYKIGCAIAFLVMVAGFQNCSPQGFNVASSLGTQNLNMGSSAPTPTPVGATPTPAPGATATPSVTATPTPTPAATATPVPGSYGSAITTIKNVLLDGDSNTANGGVGPKLQSTIDDRAKPGHSDYGTTLSIDITGYAGANIATGGRFNWANLRAKGAMNLVENWAIIGSPVSHVLGNAPFGILLPIDTVILAGTTNDFQIPDANINQAVADQILATMLAAVDAYVAAGKNVIVETCPPYAAIAGSGYNAAGPNHKTWIAYYNQKLIAAAHARTRVLVNDINAVGGPQDANDIPTTPGMLVSDGLHVSSKFGRLAGDQLYDLIKDHIAADTSYHVSSANDNRTTTPASLQLVPNPLMTGAGGALSAGANASGTVPTGYTWDGVGDYNKPVPATAIASVAPRADGYGNDAIMTFTAGPSGTTMIFNVALNPAQFASGKTYYGEAFIELSNLSQLSDAYLGMGMTGGGTFTQRLAMAGAPGSDGLPSSYVSSDIKGVWRTEKMRASGSVTSPYMSFRIYLGPNGSATVKIGRVALVEGTP